MTEWRSTVAVTTENDLRAPADRPAVVPAVDAGKGDARAGALRLDFPVSVVLPAGGTGERTGLQTPKQFCSFLGRPLISYTIQAFERASWIQSIVVVVAKENMDLMSDIVRRFRHMRVRLVSSGSTRHRSICNGVLALGENGPEAERPRVVVIHDAVRPFVDEEFLHQIVVAAKEHGAAGAIRPLVSTVIAVTSEGFLDHSLERAKYRASEMPQAFAFDVIHEAYQRCSEHDFEFGTECLHLALQYCGVNAKLIEGPATLWKVTYKRDLAAAESIVKDSLSKSACMITGGCAAARALADSFQKSFGSLDMSLNPVPDVTGENSGRLSTESNFIQVASNYPCLSELEVLIQTLQKAHRTLLHPLVIILIHLNTSDEPSISDSDGSSGFMALALNSKPHNVLLFGIRLQWPQGSQRCERSAVRAAEISAALIRERSPALVGQMLRA